MFGGSLCQTISTFIYSTNTVMESYWVPDHVSGTGDQAVSNTKSLPS